MVIGNKQNYWEAIPALTVYSELPFPLFFKAQLMSLDLRSLISDLQFEMCALGVVLRGTANGS